MDIVNINTGGMHAHKELSLCRFGHADIMHVEVCLKLPDVKRSGIAQCFHTSSSVSD